MANKDPSKTEKPTSKRISKCRQDGKVIMSRDVNAVVITLTGVVLMYWTVPRTAGVFRDMWRSLLEIDCRATWTPTNFSQSAWLGGEIMAKLLGPILFCLCLSAIVVIRTQVGSYFSTKPLKWKYKVFNPVGGYKGLMPDKKKIITLGLTIAKLSVISLIIYKDVRSGLPQLMGLSDLPVGAGMVWMLRRFAVITFKVLAFFVIIAIIDYIMKRKHYFEDLMMTKQEVKDERKMSDGDPLIKAKIRQKMMSMAMARMATDVPKADVVITNPTHVAVALRYQRGDHAPRVMAKGLRKRAERIKELARAANVPILEIPPLARSLYREAQVGGFIPPDFYSAVAAVLARLQQAGRRMFG